MQAKDVMTRNVVTVAPDMPLVEAARVLIAARVSSAPVVDGGKLVGIVSEGDFIHRSEIGTSPQRPWWQIFSLDPEQHASEFLRVHASTVAHAMTRQVVTATEDATLGHIVDLFDRFHINRVPILRDGALVGAIGRGDILRLLAASAPAPTGPRSDADIARDLEALLAEATWATVTSIAAAIDHDVRNGVIRLRGVLGSEHERAALLVAARNIPGVKDVDDDGLSVAPRDITAF